MTFTPTLPTILSVAKIEAGTYDCANGDGSVEITDNDLTNPANLNKQIANATDIYAAKCNRANCPSNCKIRQLIDEASL